MTVSRHHLLSIELNHSIHLKLLDFPGLAEFLSAHLSGTIVIVIDKIPDVFCYFPMLPP